MRSLFRQSLRWGAALVLTTLVWGLYGVASPGYCDARGFSRCIRACNAVRGACHDRCQSDCAVIDPANVDACLSFCTELCTAELQDCHGLCVECLKGFPEEP